MWGVQGVAQRQEPLHPPLAHLLVCMHQTCLLFAPGSHTQSPWSRYACPPPSQPLVHICQPFWSTCPGFVLICPGLRIPASHSLLVHVCSPSLFLAPQFVFVGHLAGLLGHVHCACLCSFVLVQISLSFGGFIFRLPGLSDMVST